jgi:hypothetical protein
MDIKQQSTHYDLGYRVSVRTYVIGRARIC